MSDNIVHSEEFRGYQLEVRLDRGAYWSIASDPSVRLDTNPRKTRAEAIAQARIEILKREIGETSRPSCLLDCVSGEVVYLNPGDENALDFPYGESYRDLDLEREIVPLGSSLLCKVTMP